MQQKIESKAVFWRMVLSTLSTCITSVCAGMTLGVSAVLLPQLKQDKEFHYDGSLDSWIASIANLTMILGSAFSGLLLDRYGRRLALILLGIPFIIGWICIACARTATMIMMGRLITGMSSGARHPVTIVYISEIVDPKYRTTALMFPIAMLHVGVLLTHIMGSYFSWRVNAIVCMFPPLISSICFLYLRESPLWLISKRRTEEGVNSFYWFRGTEEAAKAELTAVLERSKDVTINNTFRDTMRVVCKLSFLKPFMIAVFLAANMHWAGVVVLYYYANDIFEGTFDGQVDSVMMMIVTDCIRGLSALIVSFVANVVPKKIAFIASSLGISTSLYILLAYLLVLKHGHLWVPITCLVTFIGLSGSFTSIGWSFVPEILPNSTRGIGSGMTTTVAFLFQFIIVKITPDIINCYGMVTLYGMFATCAFVFSMFLIFVLPETGGKTLQSIEDSINKRDKSDETAL